MRPSRHGKKRSRRALFGYVAAFLTILGLLVSIYAAFYLRPDIPDQAQPIENSLECTVPTKRSSETESAPAEPAPIQTDQTPLYAVAPRVGERIGTISLPTLDLSWEIYQGTEEAQLSVGVGHYTGSVLPGMNDNSILSGHRTTVFNRIGELEVNDLILIETDPGVFTYQVRDFRIVDRSDQTVIQPTATATLTLTTCYPFDSLTRTTQAFLVEADLIDSRLIQP